MEPWFPACDLACLWIMGYLRILRVCWAPNYFHFWPHRTLPRSLGDGKNVRSITPNLWSSGALKFACSPVQRGYFWHLKHHGSYLGVRIRPCWVRASVNIMTLGAYVNLEIKTMAFFPVGSAMILYKQFNTSQCISCVWNLFGIEANMENLKVVMICINCIILSHISTETLWKKSKCYLSD